MTLSPEEIARRSAAAMWARDGGSKGMGASLDAVGPGTATLSFTVEARHTNGHSNCHGGYIFMLADAALGYACNSHGRPAVAQHNTITYVAPARPGDRLTAEAREVALYGRSGLYDVRVTDQDGRVVAEFRGASRTLPARNFEE